MCEESQFVYYTTSTISGWKKQVCWQACLIRVHYLLSMIFQRRDLMNNNMKCVHVASERARWSQVSFVSILLLLVLIVGMVMLVVVVVVISVAVRLFCFLLFLDGLDFYIIPS